MAWATNAFMLCFGSALMAAGALADSYGRRRVFLAGALGFALTSLALVAAPDILVFDLLRGGQGLAAAAAYAGGSAALAQLFDGRGRLRAFSLVGTSFGAGLSLGPVASGLMISAFGWRSIFLAVVAFTALAFALGRRALPESRDPRRHRSRPAGLLAFTAMLALFTYGMLLVPERGWSDGRVLTLLFVRSSASLCSSGSSGASRGRCWTSRCSAIPASSACSSWPPPRPTGSWCCSSSCRCAFVGIEA